MKFSKEVLAIVGIGFVAKMILRPSLRRAVRSRDNEDEDNDSDMDHEQMDIIPDRGR